MKKLFIIIGLLSLYFISFAQSPVLKTYAYNRKTVSGIPGMNTNDGNANTGTLPQDVFLYLEVKKGSAVGVSEVWIGEKVYNATAKKVTSPVAVEKSAGVPTKEKTVLVNKTSNDVYQISLGAEKEGTSLTAVNCKLLNANKVLILLKCNKKSVPVAIKTMKELEANYGM